MKILDRLRRVFKIKGDGIDFYWQNYDHRVVCGHRGWPEKGDVFTCKMQSGKIGVFEVVNVRRCSEPGNMYFADVRDVGYWEVQAHGR